MFKAVIFDFDGVLVDSGIVTMEARARALAHFGYELSQEDRQKIFGLHSEEYTKIFQKKIGFSEEIRKTLVKKISEEIDLIFEGLIKPMPYIKEILEFFKTRKVVLGIATTNKQKRVDIFLNKYGLQSYFDFTITSEDITKRKPDPEVYLTAKSRTPFSAEEILAIEDTEYGVISAKEAGLKCAAIPTHLSKDHDFSRADYVFNSMKEVEKLFV